MTDMPIHLWPRKHNAATEALQESRENLAVAEQRAEEASTIAHVLRLGRRENHFGPDIRAALEGN